LVIDDRGQASEGALQPAFHRLSGSMSLQQYVDFRVINCRWAAIRHRRQHLHLRFRPAMVAEAALVELLYHACDMPWRRAAATMFIGNAWRDEILPVAPEEAVRRISSIVMKSQLRPGSTVLRRSRSVGSIPPNSPLGHALRCWRHRPDLASPGRLQAMLSGEVGGRYGWVHASTRKRELIMMEVGSGFPDAVRSLLNPGLGYRLEDQPDIAYGRYCADAYGAVARTQMPAMEDVDAIMRPPNGASVRRRYTRLILPFRSPNGNARLLGISFENSAVDLRRAI
jgi:hypothetical protein